MAPLEILLPSSAAVDEGSRLRQAETGQKLSLRSRRRVHQGTSNSPSHFTSSRVTIGGVKSGN